MLSNPSDNILNFLFTDIEGSSRLWERFPESMKVALAAHDEVLHRAITTHGGRVVKSTGDGCLAVFSAAAGSLAAAIDAQRALSDIEPQRFPETPEVFELRVRMGLHCGEAELRDGDFYGSPVNRAARIMDIGHGGQILLSAAIAALLADTLPPGVTLRDMGDHRLKDLLRPERIYQIVAVGLRADFPPLRSLNAYPGNLPVQLTSFVGRERELAEVTRLLPATRLLTLTGPGGTGKTRLSLQLAAEVQAEYAHGVWLLELAPLTDPTLVPVAAAGLFTLGAMAGAPLMNILTDYLRGKQVLLILDNCEHLVESCAQLAAELLPVCPRLTILASSREGLGVPGETTFHVPTLSLPDSTEITPQAACRFDAVELFVQRAGAAQPGFTLTGRNTAAVAQIVRRLDGIPLAIELAAARVRLLSPQQIAARLDDRFRLLTGGSRTALPRQQTLRALIDWSYDLLSPPEALLFRRLGVFVGGWTLEAAEEVAGDEPGMTSGPAGARIERDEVLDLLAGLVNKSLVVVDTEDSAPANSAVASDSPRYRFLETIRQYARDKLFEAGETAAARDRHLDYFAHLVLDYGPITSGLDSITLFSDIGTPAYLRWMGRVLPEVDNIRVAQEWGHETDPERALAVTIDLGPVVLIAGGSEQLLEALRKGRGLVNALPLAGGASGERRALLVAGSLLMEANALFGQATIDEQLDILRQGIALARTHDFRAMLGAGLLSSAASGAAYGFRPEAYDYAAESVAIFNELGYPAGGSLPLAIMAQLKVREGDFEGAAMLQDEARRAIQASKTAITAGLANLWLGMTTEALGRIDEAIAIHERTAAAFRRQGNRAMATQSQDAVGQLERRRGREDVAEIIMKDTIQQYRDLGIRPLVAGQLEVLAFLAIHGRDRNERAATLLGAAEALRERAGVALLPHERPEYDAEVAALRRVMDPVALDAAWRAGRSLDMDAAVEYAVAS